MCHGDKHVLGRHCNRVVRMGGGGGGLLTFFRVYH